MKNLKEEWASYWCQEYNMKEELKLDDPSLDSTMFSFAPESPTFVNDSVWTAPTQSVTDINLSRPSYVDAENMAQMGQRGLNISEADFFQFLQDKDTVDKKAIDEDEEMKETIRRERLYARPEPEPEPEDRKVSGSGASVHSGRFLSGLDR